MDDIVGSRSIPTRATDTSYLVPLLEEIGLSFWEVGDSPVTLFGLTKLTLAGRGTEEVRRMSRTPLSWLPRLGLVESYTTGG